MSEGHGPQARVVEYEPGERPDIEVCIDGTWCEGELRMWRWREDRAPTGWWASVQWRRGPGEGTHLDQVPARLVRLAYGDGSSILESTNG